MLDRGCHDALESLGYDLRTILYCESNVYAQAILKARMQDRAIQEAPIWPDVTTLNATQLRGSVDAIVAGFPCQPFSFAGKRAGIQDERYLFADIIRIANEANVPLLFLENVPGVLTTGKSATAPPVADVMRLLAEARFDAVWQCVSASEDEIGAPHKRERFFCIAWRELADTECHGQTEPTITGGSSDLSATEQAGSYLLPNAA